MSLGRLRSLLLLLPIAGIASLAQSADDPPAVRVEQTPTGVRYGLLGDASGGPRPTLFIFAVGIETSWKARTTAARADCCCPTASFAWPSTSHATARTFAPVKPRG